MDKTRKKMPTKTKKNVSTLCGVIKPGPKYKLKTLVGYKGHCLSKYRNPAYTFGERLPCVPTLKIHGAPMYMIKEYKRKGFTFGEATKSRDVSFGPGPKYLLPIDSRGPAFSIKLKTKPRKVTETPGHYNVKSVIDAPSFSIGMRMPTKKPATSAGFHPPCNLNITKPKAPWYSISYKKPTRSITTAPGPIYKIAPPKPFPAFSFGVKHSECAPPYIVECDDQC